LSSAYSPAPGFFDELFDAPDRPRGPAAALTATLARLGSEHLRSAGERRDAIFVQQGITFDASGPDGGPSRDHPFPLDLIPRLLPAAEWRTIKRGLAQRVRAPNAAPVSRFMLYEREFPDSVAASVQSLDGALERVELDPQDSPPVLRVRRMLADLDFRARVASAPDAVTPWLRPVQQELERLDAEIDDRYFHPSTPLPTTASQFPRGSEGGSPRSASG
jgi:A predicted alpha-helical domain with a conserved ER motif.